MSRSLLFPATTQAKPEIFAFAPLVRTLVAQEDAPTDRR